jgi:uncharacterized membrane protein YoaK (UPF0700 family)
MTSWRADPSEDARLARVQPLLLSAVAGAVDAIGFMALKLFTAHITGNLVVIAVLLARAGPPTLDQALSIPIFLLATAGAWFIATLVPKRGSALARVLLSVQLLLLICVLVFSVFTRPDMQPRGLSADITALMAISAMACQYVLLQLAIPGAPPTAVMTGNIAKAVLGLLDTWIGSNKAPLLRDAERHLKRSLALVLVFFVGCMAGAFAFLWRGDWAWLLPVALAALALVVCPSGKEAAG